MKSAHMQVVEPSYLFIKLQTYWTLRLGRVTARVLAASGDRKRDAVKAKGTSTRLLAKNVVCFTLQEPVLMYLYL